MSAKVLHNTVDHVLDIQDPCVRQCRVLSLPNGHPWHLHFEVGMETWVDMHFHFPIMHAQPISLR